MAKNGNSLMKSMAKAGENALSKELFTREVGQMSTEEAHLAWSMLDVLSKSADVRLKEMRDRLLAEAKEHGHMDPKGSYFLTLDDGEVKAERREGKPKVNELKLATLLVERGIDPTRVIKEKTVVEYDLDALAELADAGVLTEDEAAGVFEQGKVSYALKVVKPAGLPKPLRAKK